MIRYRLRKQTLLDRIEAANATWWTRAAAHTRTMAQAGVLVEKGAPDWGEIKSAFMDLQHNKCAYCERKLPDPAFGSIEHDVEHFRPKNAVPVWPGPTDRNAPKTPYTFSTGAPHPEGYYLLAWNPFNYAVACKTCNTPLKLNRFPIAGTRAPHALDVDSYDSERPYVIFPLGLRGPDPRRVIGFRGIMAYPRVASGYRHRLGLVTIDFFQLNAREELLAGRAMAVVGVWKARQLLSSPNRRVADRARSSLDLLLSPRAAHSACAEDFDTLMLVNPGSADPLVDEALTYLKSSG